LELNVDLKGTITRLLYKMDVSVILYKISNKVSKKLIRQTDTNRLTAAGMNGVKTSIINCATGRWTHSKLGLGHTHNKQTK